MMIDQTKKHRYAYTAIIYTADYAASIFVAFTLWVFYRHEIELSREVLLQQMQK